MSDDFNRGTRNFDGVSFEDATLPSGYEIAENSSGDLVIKDTNGNTVFRWDSSAGEWNIESNALTNISSVSAGGIDVASAGSVSGLVSQAVTHGKVLADDSVLYDSVQTAENNATDWIFIGTGTFNESVTIDTSGLTVRGCGQSSTLIDGGTTGTAVQITSSKVSVSGLSVRTSGGAGNNYDALTVSTNVSRISISHVSVADSDRHGINLNNGNDIRIVGNLIQSADNTEIVLSSNTNRNIVTSNATLNGAISDSGTGNAVANNT